ncbi:hypothetical protein QTP86_009452 [Hemibagrus guttatus]|nr:hypothetical protein QTP86_009452 [Hemibagrus guttatus]
MKLWERVVEARLRKVVEICEQQYGFMPRKSTTDAIFALRILMEKYRDGQRELHCVFVDLEKAYDRVPREELWYCMRKSGVAEKYVRVVQDMYERSRTVVKCAVGQTEEFNVEVGLHQGSALSPFLFAMVMDQLSEEVRQESPWTMMFADDIVICSESREQGAGGGKPGEVEVCAGEKRNEGTAESQISARVGSTVILPCEWRNISVQVPHVQWNKVSETVFERKGVELYEGEGYEGRVDVPQDKLLVGNCSLVLKNVSLTDAGIYESYLSVRRMKRASSTKWVLVQWVKLSVDETPVENVNNKSKNLNIFSSATSSSDSCLFLSDTVSKPYSMAGLTTVLYTFPLILADIF